MKKIALIGSFKQFYREIQSVFDFFVSKGLLITSPAGTEITRPDIPFVRFTSDNPDLSDEMIQTVTLKRIFSSDLVYVVAPNGYIGRTTCYEVGRMIQAMKPIYFSEQPQDLPIKIPDSHILSPLDMIEEIKKDKVTWLYHNGNNELHLLEKDLVKTV